MMKGTWHRKRKAGTDGQEEEGERWARALHTPGEGTALWTVTMADCDCWKAVSTCDDLTGCGQQKALHTH